MPKSRIRVIDLETAGNLDTAINDIARLKAQEIGDIREKVAQFKRKDMSNEWD